MVSMLNNSLKREIPVSVVIPCYNCEKTISRAVRSVAEQTQKPHELILVNDGSFDDTGNILEILQYEFGNDWVKIIDFAKNNGPALSRNAGWDAATQHYVAFLDADDAWNAHKVEIQLNYMRTHPEVSITGHRWYWLREGRPLPRIPENYTVKPISRWQMLIANRLATPTVMLKRDLDFRFNPAKRHSEDYLLWLRIICSGTTAHFIDLDLTYLYKAPYGMGGMSSQLWTMERGELDTYRRLRDDKLISWPSFMALSAFSVVKYVRRNLISKLRVMRYEI